MAKYIDADTIVGLRLFDDTCGKEKTTIEVDTIENILDGFTKEGCPEPADVAPVRHARWVNGCCDRCGEHALYWSMASTYHESDFCPYCGAKMDA